MFFYLEPEVAGGLGPKSKMHRADGRLVVTRLNYEFDGWLGDPILESTPCFVASDKLRQVIETRSLTGVSFENVDVSCSATFRELHSGRELPRFWWLVVSGVAFEEDFGLAPDLRLVVSEQALEALKSEGMKHAVVSDIAP